MLTHVLLDRKMTEEGLLPRVCVCCGKPAVVYVERRFFWAASLPAPFLLLNLLIPGITGLLFAGSMEWMTVRLPFCPIHRHHFFWSNALPRNLLIAVIIFGFVALSQEIVWLWIPPAVGLLFFVVWLRIGRPAIHARNITGWSFVLSDVSTEFVSELSKVGYLTPAVANPDPCGTDGLNLPKYPG
jgi:hypothetical protein